MTRQVKIEMNPWKLVHILGILKTVGALAALVVVVRSVSLNRRSCQLQELGVNAANSMAFASMVLTGIMFPGVALISSSNAGITGKCCINSRTSSFQISPKTNVGVHLGINEHQGAANDHQYLIWTALKGGSCGSS